MTESIEEASGWGWRAVVTELIRDVLGENWFQVVRAKKKKKRTIIEETSLWRPEQGNTSLCHVSEIKVNGWIITFASPWWDTYVKCIELIYCIYILSRWQRKGGTKLQFQKCLATLTFLKMIYTQVKGRKLYSGSDIQEEARPARLPLKVMADSWKQNSLQIRETDSKALTDTRKLKTTSPHHSHWKRLGADLLVPPYLPVHSTARNMRLQRQFQPDQKSGLFFNSNAL